MLRLVLTSSPLRERIYYVTSDGFLHSSPTTRFQSEVYQQLHFGAIILILILMEAKFAFMMSENDELLRLI